jgi:hypothetical protein
MVLPSWSWKENSLADTGIDSIGVKSASANPSVKVKPAGSSMEMIF